MEPGVKSSVPTGDDTSKKIVSSSAAAKPNGKSPSSSAVVPKPRGKAAASSAIPMTPIAATVLPAPIVNPVMLFRDVSLGPHEADLRFRLIHFWEAINPKTKNLIGQEMLLIDEEVVFSMNVYKIMLVKKCRSVPILKSQKSLEYPRMKREATPRCR